MNSAEQTILGLQQQGTGPLIVVGHSSGGMTVNELGERLGPKVIDHMVYLTAFMTPAGKTGNDVVTVDGQFGSITSTVFVGDISVTGVIRVNPNSTDPTYQAQATNVFYNDVPAEQLPAIFNLLKTTRQPPIRQPPALPGNDGVKFRALLYVVHLITRFRLEVRTL